MASYLYEFKDDPVFQDFRRELLSREMTDEKQMSELIEKLKIGDNERWIDFIKAMEGIEISVSRRQRRRGERTGKTVYINLAWEKDESFYNYALRVIRNK